MPKHEPLCRRSEKSEVWGVILIVMWEEDGSDSLRVDQGSEWAGLSGWIRAPHSFLRLRAESATPTSLATDTHFSWHQLSSRQLDLTFSCILLPRNSTSSLLKTMSPPLGSQVSFFEAISKFYIKVLRRIWPTSQLVQNKVSLLLMSKSYDSLSLFY